MRSSRRSRVASNCSIRCSNPPTPPFPAVALAAGEDSVVLNRMYLPAAGLRARARIEKVGVDGGSSGGARVRRRCERHGWGGSGRGRLGSGLDGWTASSRVERRCGARAKGGMSGGG